MSQNDIYILNLLFNEGKEDEFHAMAIDLYNSGCLNEYEKNELERLDPDVKRNSLFVRFNEKEITILLHGIYKDLSPSERNERIQRIIAMRTTYLMEKELREQE